MINKNLLTAAVVTAIAGASLIACGGGSVTSAGPTPAGAPPAAVPAAASFTVKVLGFNDYHGNLEAFGTFGETSSVPAAQRPPVGGADFLAAHIARLKAQNPNNVVIAAGDNIGASPLISSLFLDEPAVETLNRIGLDFTSVGNH